MKKKLGYIGLLCLVMFGLSGLLFLVEENADGSAITSIQDALVDMLVTLTTVG